MVLKSVSTVKKFLTISIGLNNFDSLEWKSLDNIDQNIQKSRQLRSCWLFQKVDKFSISIGLDSRDHQAYKIDISSFYRETTQSTLW